jgi:hypothetical protein
LSLSTYCGAHRLPTMLKEEELWKLSKCCFHRETFLSPPPMQGPLLFLIGSTLDHADMGAFQWTLISLSPQSK